MTVAIVGLGLMGGSLAHDLARLGIRVLAHDTRSDVVASALDSGAVHEILDSSDLTGVSAAEIVVVATPVDRSLDVLARLAPHLRSDAVVTDLGSTKAAIVAHAEAIGIGERFVGSHPLAGDHRSGWSAARPALYRGAPVFLCSTPSTRPETIARARALWESIGAEPLVLDADEHDRRMAWISQLPQIASSAIALALSGAGHSRAQLGPGGRDMTRLAGSSPEMWSAIVRSNASPIADAVLRLRTHLETVETALRKGDESTVDAFFRGAHDWAS